MTQKLNLTRDQLASFLKSPEQIKQFENIFMSVDGLIPLVPVEKGGTGATSLTGIVKGNGTSPFTAGSVNMATEVTGTLQTANGGTGSTLTAYCSLSTNVAGTLPVINGGTGQTSYINGEILIGNSAGNTLSKATLTAGANITITNGAGSITIALSGGASGSFTAASGEVVTVVNGIITSIV